MNTQKIGIVTVLYNSANVLPGFFDSLAKQTYRDFVLYAIENKSPDASLDTVKALAKDAPFETIIIEAEDNGGVAKGNNLGIERAIADGCQLVLLANNDIEFGADTIRLLLESMRANKCAMAVPKIFNYFTGKLWYAGGGYGYKFPTYHAGIRECDAPKYNVAKTVDYAPTCFMLIESEVFAKAGIMDERYFAYFDDTDFIWRAVKHCGYSIWYEPKAVVMHKIGNASGSKPSPFGFYLDTRNSAYFMNKYFPWYRRWGVNAYQFAYYFLYTLKHRDFPSVWQKLKHYREGLALYAQWRSEPRHPYLP